MKNNTIIDILKTAILMERRGKAFYEKVAEQAKSEEVKKVFKMMAEEENSHIEFLSNQYVSFQKNKAFTDINFKSGQINNEIAKKILSKELRKQISASDFESAAISAAIDMENKAVDFYSERAESAIDENEKNMFLWLADWEKGHSKILIDMNKELTEQIWYDNNFWPF